MSWTNISKPGAQSYTDVAKPTTLAYTNVAKPTSGYTLKAGATMGLIAPPTYAVTRTFGNLNTYTNIPKPT